MAYEDISSLRASLHAAWCHLVSLPVSTSICHHTGHLTPQLFKQMVRKQSQVWEIIKPRGNMALRVGSRGVRNPVLAGLPTDGMIAGKLCTLPGPQWSCSWEQQQQEQPASTLLAHVGMEQSRILGRELGRAVCLSSLLKRECACVYAPGECQPVWFSRRLYVLIPAELSTSRSIDGSQLQTHLDSPEDWPVAKLLPVRAFGDDALSRGTPTCHPRANLPSQGQSYSGQGRDLRIPLATTEVSWRGPCLISQSQADSPRSLLLALPSSIIRAHTHTPHHLISCSETRREDLQFFHPSHWDAPH